jgi:hypothetical protein
MERDIDMDMDTERDMNIYWESAAKKPSNFTLLLPFPLDSKSA